MKRFNTPLVAMFLLASMEVAAQGRIANTYPYSQNFTWVTGTTTGFPVTNVDGGEFTADAGTSPLWTTTLGGHGLHNNGGGAIRIQTTGSGGAAGFVWYGSFVAACPDSLILDWSKVVNPAAGTRVNELRVATNSGAGSTFTDVPAANVAGGAWPRFDNQSTPQSGALRQKLPHCLSGSADARIRIYAVNVSGAGNQPRALVDNLAITVLAAPLPGAIDSISGVGRSTMTLHLNPGGDADSVVVLRRAGVAPTSVPANGVRYRAGDVLNATDTVVFVGAGGVRALVMTGLAPGTTYHTAMFGMRTCNGEYSKVPAVASATTLPCSGPPGALSVPLTMQRSRDMVAIGYTPGENADSVLVVRGNAAAPAFVPVDGSRYAPGQAVGPRDTVAYFGPAASVVTVRGLQADSVYVFALYGYQACNGRYSLLPALDTARTYCIGSAPMPRGVRVRFTTAYSLGLAVDGMGDTAGVVVFSAGPDTAQPRPVDGVPYAEGSILGDDTVRYVGPGANAVLRGLVPGTSYRLVVRLFRRCNYAYSPGSVTLNATTYGPCINGVPSGLDSIRIVKNVRDTLRLAWRSAQLADGYLLVARTDSTPMRAPLNGEFYVPGDSLGAGCHILGSVRDTAITAVRLPANTAYFVRLYPYRACDLAYGPPSATLAVATVGDSLAQRFAMRANLPTSIAFAGANIRFRTGAPADGSLLITRPATAAGTAGIPMMRNGRDPINVTIGGHWWRIRTTGLGAARADLAFSFAGIAGIRDTTDLEVLYRLPGEQAWEDFITTERVHVPALLVAAGRPSVAGDYAIGASVDLTTLPVKLEMLDGYAANDGNVLYWRTLSEVNTVGFRLYRAPLGADTVFRPVADYRQDARLLGAGTRNGPTDYSYVDTATGRTSAHRNLYRLEEVSTDGSIANVGQVVIDSDRPTSVLAARLWVVPNPASNWATAYCAGGYDETVELVDQYGRIVPARVTQTGVVAGPRTFRIDFTGLAVGLYFVRTAGCAGVAVAPVLVAGR